jgi:hypothetical protein
LAWNHLEQIKNSENSTPDETGDVWMSICLFPNTKAMANQKTSKKATKTKKVDILSVIRKNKSKASKKQQKPTKLGYLSIGERQQVLLLKNLGFSEDNIGLALGCSRSTVSPRNSFWTSPWWQGIHFPAR